MALPCMVYEQDEREAVHHFRTLAAGTGLPIMIYNNPLAYKVDLRPEGFLGLADFKARDEFYYMLKFTKAKTPLLNVTIDGESHPVAWALEREGGGRSFGFSGLHFHENWQSPEYRRLVTQGVMWILDLPIPKDGIAVK